MNLSSDETVQIQQFQEIMLKISENNLTFKIFGIILDIHNSTQKNYNDDLTQSKIFSDETMKSTQNNTEKKPNIFDLLKRETGKSFEKQFNEEKKEVVNEENQLSEIKLQKRRKGISKKFLLNSPIQSEESENIKLIQLKSKKLKMKLIDDSDYSEQDLSNLQLNKNKKLILSSSPPEERKKMVRKRLKKIITKHRESRANKIEFQGDDKCVICQDKVQYPQGRIACLHIFCFSCINDWGKVTNLCPLCKTEFQQIDQYDDQGNKINETIVKRKKQEYVYDEHDILNAVTDSDNENDYCYECGENNNEQVLLICDLCNKYCCHTYCNCPQLDRIPDGDWICKYCLEEIPDNFSESS